MYNLAEKYPKLGKGPNPFIDPEGYKHELDIEEHAFLQGAGRAEEGRRSLATRLGRRVPHVHGQQHQQPRGEKRDER